MQRTRAWRRAQRQRWAARRRRILKSFYTWRPSDFDGGYWTDGRLSKYNFGCTCRMCHYVHFYERQEQAIKDANTPPTLEERVARRAA